jgi:mono/diheme cytochrome c family protein
LHALDFSDQWIANRIRDGKKGKMTAFGGKLQPADIDALVAYLHTLK